MEILHDPEVQLQQVHTVHWLTIHQLYFTSLLSTLSTIAVTESDLVAKDYIYCIYTLPL